MSPTVVVTGKRGFHAISGQGLGPGEEVEHPPPEKIYLPAFRKLQACRGLTTCFWLPPLIFLPLGRARKSVGGSLQQRVERGRRGREGGSGKHGRKAKEREERFQAPPIGIPSSCGSK